MSKKTPQEFLIEHRTNFNKHVDTLIKADQCLEQEDWDGFDKIYGDMSQEDLAVIAKAQHLKANEIFGRYKEMCDVVMNIAKDISSCKTLDDFHKVRDQAQVIIMAQQMVDRGEKPEEVAAKLSKAQQGEQTLVQANDSGIILQ